MLNVRDVHSRRKTLSLATIRQCTRIKVSQYSNSRRFQAIDPAMYPALPWISEFKDDNTHVIAPPEKLKPNEVKCAASLCEEDLKDYENMDEKEVEKVVENLDDRSFQTSYVSVPIIDINAADQLGGQAMFTGAPKPPDIQFLHIKEVKFELSGLATSIFMDMFVYTDKPLCEPVRFKFDAEKDKFWMYGRETKGVMLPFPGDPAVARVVLVLYMPSPDSEILGRPFSIGYRKILDDEGVREMKMIFCSCQSGLTIPQYFDKPGNLTSLSCTFSAEILTEHDPKITAKLTAFDPLFPSPLLTVSNITLDMKIKKKEKTQRNSIVCRVSLRSMDKEKEKEERIIENAVQPCSEKPAAVNQTASLMPGDRVAFPDNLTFLMGPDMETELMIVVDVLWLDNNKYKLILSGQMPIKEPRKTVTLKMEKKAGMFSGISKGDNSVTFTYMYPSVVNPPKVYLSSLTTPNVPCQQLDPMYVDLVPYIVMQNLSLPNVKTVSFETLFKLLPYTSGEFMKSFQMWIENFFSCKPGFHSEYLYRLGNHLDDVAEWPVPFFQIIVKAVCVEKKVDEEVLSKFLKKCAEYTEEHQEKGKAIRSCAADLLLEMSMFWDPWASPIVHRLACKYIRLLSNSARLDVFKHFFTDVAFIMSMTVVRLTSEQVATLTISPYIPLLSLFFETLNQVFVDNKKDETNMAAADLRLLATTLEMYSDGDSSAQATTALFPLLPMIFTFYDSLVTQLENRSMLSPILLYLMKNANGNQFKNYWSILSYDNQLRFLEFLVILSDTETISSVSRNSVSMSGNGLSCAHEVTWRILLFMCFYQDIAQTDARTLQAIFDLLIHMLNSPRQAADSFRMIFKSMAFFIQKYKNIIFIDETKLVVLILKAVVPITQRKLAEARVCGIGFVKWLIKTEKLVAEGSCDRCNIALRYAVCCSFFENNNFMSFFKFLPSEMSAVDQLYEQIKSAMTRALIHETQVRELLKLYQEHKDFVSIRARIYAKIVELNRMNGDYASAFITQWRLCGLIAEVFKLKDQQVDGIPAGGFQAFPFIYDEPSIDLNHGPAKARYLLLESELFTENYMAVALQEALSLSQMAGINWVIRQVTEYLFDFLEKRREFELLTNLYNSVTDAYAALTKDDSPQVEFSRVFIGDSVREKVRCSEVIRISAMSKRRELPLLKQSSQITLMEDESLPVTKCDGNVIQVIKVNYCLKDLLALKVQSFYKDVVIDQTCGWSSLFVERFTYTTEHPLPSCVGIANIANTTSSKISREQYYMEKLNKYKQKYSGLISSISAVLPPTRLIAQWSMCVLGISTQPVLKMMAKIADAKNVEGQPPYYWFVLQENIPDGAVSPDAPPALKQLAGEVWDMLRLSIPTIGQTQKLNKPTLDEEQMFNRFSALFALQE